MASTQKPDGDKRPRVCFVGLDAATLDLVRPWVIEGKLPTFAKLMNEGCYGELTVEIPPVTVPNWPTLVMGKNTGKHGLVYFIRRRAEEIKTSVINYQWFKHQTIWEILGRWGKKSIVVNVPVTYPPQPMNGLMITGYLSPPSARDITYPPDLLAEIETQVGEYKLYPDVVYAPGKEEKFLANLHQMVDQRVGTVQYLMKNYEWDFFMVVFMSTDMVQHALWRFMDQSHPDYDPEGAKKYGEGILSIYQRMDEALHWIIEELDEQDHLIVASDHGAGKLLQKTHLNNWLLDAGLLQLKRRPLTRVKYWLFRHGFTPQTALALAYRMGLSDLRKKFHTPKKPKGFLRKLFLSYHDIDWARTKAYAFGGLGQIYINVKGREPYGRLVAGSQEYEDLRDEIIRQLKEITLPGSDVPFVDRAHKKEELFWGDELDSLPDILIIPHNMEYEDVGIYEFWSNKLFDHLAGAMSGMHRELGMFMIWGPGVKAGLEVEGTHILDMAPTMLYLLGVPVPGELDGKVLTGAIEDTHVRSHPVDYTDVSTDKRNLDEEYSSEEDEAIRERLKALGYLQ